MGSTSTIAIGKPNSEPYLSSNPNPLAVPLEDRFSAFNISTHAYKVVDDHPILVDVLIPRSLTSGGMKIKTPVLVRIHGGWLVGGSRDFADWCPAWTIELALKHGAIMVQPDYRLLPEATGEDILDDVDDFWAWLGRDLPSIVRESGIEADLDRVLVSGESAGGYLSLQTALSFFPPAPLRPCPRVLVSSFPMLYLRGARYTQRYHKQIFDVPQLPESLIDAHLASIAGAPGSRRPVVSSTPMVDAPRGALAFALVQHGRFAEVLGQERDPALGKRRLHPEDRVADGRVLPPTLFLHGIDDSAVPVDGTDQFIELLREKKAVAGLGEGKQEKEVLGYIKVPGEHGFHSDVKLGDAEWTDEAVSFIERHWL